MKSTVYKIITAIIGILGAIGGIILGNIVPSLTYDKSFNIGVMISSWIGVAIICFIFYGIASIFEHLEHLEIICGTHTTMENITQSANSNLITKPMEIGDWVCPECGKINKKYVGSCGCGHYKNN